MKFHPNRVIALGIWIALAAGIGCSADSKGGNPVAPAPVAASSAQQSGAPSANGDVPPPEKIGGFDGHRAYSHVARLTQMGPRQSGTPGIEPAQQYILSELKSYGCTVETDDFHADTPAGRLAMKNILVKSPGERQDVVLLATHYDTKRLDNFVGADDGGSSTGVMLELARLLCGKRGRDSVWIAFLDGEEAVRVWSATDSRYGSRQMAARMAATGDLKRIKALLLADIVGSRDLRIRRENNSTKWVTDLVWAAAERLGYSGIFVRQESAIEDDHQPFLKRGVPAADIIDLEIPYWHTPQDTLDKISARSLAIVGHVILESLQDLSRRAH